MNLLHLLSNITGYHLSFALGNLVVHIGLFGHLPSCKIMDSCGISGKGAGGASIVNATPIGFSFQDFPEITCISIKESVTVKPSSILDH